MHEHSGPRDGTSHPVTADRDRRSAIGRLVPVLVALLAVRAIARVSRHHGGHRSRPLDRIAELHRQLHAREAAAGEVTS